MASGACQILVYPWTKTTMASGACQILMYPWTKTTMASGACQILVYPTNTTGRSTRNRGRTRNPSCFSVSSRHRSFSNFGSRVENVQQQHLGLWSTVSSSRLPPRSRVLASSTDLSLPTNATRGDDESGSSGTSLGRLDHLPAAKERSTTAETSLNRFQIENSTPKHSVWKALNRGARLVLAFFVLACMCLPNAAHSLAENSIGASSLGLRVAEFLRRSGLSDELVVVIVGMLPVLELRGAIPVGYWLKMEPVKGYLLSVLGNMIPVPFIVLYLGKILKTVEEKGETGQNFVRWIVDRTRKQAGPIEEFEWLGLLLFVAVPLPGTGAWSGAIAASLLGMPFWDAVTANLWGVLVAGLLVTLLVTVGTKEAVLVGSSLFVSSCFLWSVLRFFQKREGTSCS